LLVRQRSLNSPGELRSILPIGDDNLYGVVGARACVILLQPLSQMMRVNANHGILLRVEFGIPAKHIEGDAVFVISLACPSSRLSHKYLSRRESFGERRNVSDDNTANTSALHCSSLDRPNPRRRGCGCHD